MTDGSADRPERWMHNAMTTDRPSADALPSRVARMQLRQSIDRQCDAEVVAAFEAVLAEAGDDYRMAVREDFNLTDESWSSRSMDTFLAIASRREIRSYSDRPIADDVVRRILDAGRLAGSAKNRQPWRFLLVEDETARGRLADAVFEPGNVRGAQVVVAIIGRMSFDTGRCAQNMLLAAWNAGVGSCPNGQRDAEAARAALGLGDDEEIAIVLTFGYPARERDPERLSAEEWSSRADRKPLDELVSRV